LVGSHLGRSQLCDDMSDQFRLFDIYASKIHIDVHTAHG